MKWQSAHFVGFSFGASTVVSFILGNHEKILSAALLAPAGLLKISTEMERMLEDSRLKKEATDVVFEYLGGRPSRETSDLEAPLTGEPLAVALRQWELVEHLGYRHSVLSMFRDGGARGREEYFARAARSDTKIFAVVAELDDVCSISALERLGFEDVVMVEGVGHAFVRAVPARVALLLDEFWKKL
ncbi:hypothetical protein AMS68_005375 [Peltaster fructicola]|uniref:AB hydrolase-1 domain-containing protein n=1 Tax=Peltaster fructicola TaxID=286661 RepID=A0A6H0XZ35_9PEZI|nr:hypothetical protein AMS68_005375 [Peltaster fructicola]